jgi:hypothetical protein
MERPLPPPNSIVIVPLFSSQGLEQAESVKAMRANNTSLLFIQNSFLVLYKKRVFPHTEKSRYFPKVKKLFLWRLILFFHSVTQSITIL